ncbi:MAG TPA: hypothetical protein VGJ31_15880 [Dongiaceae bacterium]
MPASALPAGLPAGTALKNRATLSDCCDVAFHCEDGQENLGRAQIDVFIDRLGEMRAGMMVFVRSTLVDYFFNIAFARIRQPFVLVTGGSDWPSPGIHHDALEDFRVIRWFGEDSDLPAPHPKFEPVPLGISDPNVPFGDQAAMLRARARMPAVEEKPLLAHASFHLTMSHAARREALAAIRDIEGVELQRAKVAPELLWIRHAGHAFVISPRGGGLDCHRTWEALLLHSIPIVKRSPLDPLHEQFPVAIVDDWREISLAAMGEWRDRLKDRFTPDMFARLTRNYWVERIRAAAGR